MNISAKEYGRIETRKPGHLTIGLDTVNHLYLDVIARLSEYHSTIAMHKHTTWKDPENRHEDQIRQFVAGFVQVALRFVFRRRYL